MDRFWPDSDIREDQGATAAFGQKRPLLTGPQ